VLRPWVQAEYHTRLAMGTLDGLCAKEPSRSYIDNLVLNHEPPACVTGVELSKASVQAAIAVTGVPKRALCQGMVESKEIEGNDCASRDIE
jgi:hypothetical protein